MAARRRFTDEQRAEAVVLLRSHGYPERKGALALAAKELDIDAVVLRRWALGIQNPPPDHVVREKTGDTVAKLQQVVDIYLDRAIATADKTSGAQAMTTAAIAMDKLRLLQGLPTQIVSVLPDFLGALRAMGIEPDEFIQRTIAKAELEAGFRRLDAGDR